MFSIFLFTNSASKDLRSPIIADNKELFPEATSPITHTNEPFFTFKFNEWRQIYESKVLSLNLFFLISEDSAFLVSLSYKNFF